MMMTMSEPLRRFVYHPDPIATGSIVESDEVGDGELVDLGRPRSPGMGAVTAEIDGGPTAYVFQCLHCGPLGGYSDWP
jgi:uncharacterized protein CbrC (UPF0167 family)